MIERLPELVNKDRALVERGHYFTVEFLLGVGAEEYRVRVVQGRIERVERGPFLMRSWAFAIRADAEAWARFWQPRPPPGYHDLFAMTKRGLARVEGDLQPFMANLRFAARKSFRLRRITEINGSYGACQFPKTHKLRLDYAPRVGGFGHPPVLGHECSNL